MKRLQEQTYKKRAPTDSQQPIGARLIDLATGTSRKWELCDKDWAAHPGANSCRNQGGRSQAPLETGQSSRERKAPPQVRPLHRQPMVRRSPRFSSENFGFP